MKKLFLALFFLVYSVAMLGLAYKWQLAGYPKLFVGFLTKCGLSEKHIAEFWLAPPLLFSVIIPVIAFVGFYLGSSFRRTMSAMGTVCLIVGWDIYFAAHTDSYSYIPQSVTYWIFLGYFMLLALVWLVSIFYSLRPILSFAVHKKKLILEYLDALNKKSLDVYIPIRYVILWYQFENNTDEIPATVSALSEEFDSFYREVEFLER
jgi:hypothetical protein